MYVVHPFLQFAKNSNGWICKTVYIPESEGGTWVVI
jgi:hypothetical protein